MRKLAIESPAMGHVWQMSRRRGYSLPVARKKPKHQPVSRWPTVLGAAAIVVATILVYIPAIRGGFIWDDPDYVINNQTLRSAQGLIAMWTEPRVLPQWYPMVHTTFWIEYQLWQLNPLGYHLVNVVLHILGAMLLWRLLHNLRVPGAWLGAAIFALHPVHVESVAWITERKNVLSGVFYFGAMIVYLRHVELQKFNWKTYAMALALFIAALLSKTVTATFPAAVLVILWWKRGRIGWRDVKPLAPFFVLGIAFGLLTAYLEATHVGASGDRIVELRFTPLDRVLIAGRAVWFYARSLVFPHPLAFIYPRWELDPAMWWQWLFPLGALCVLAILWRRRDRLGRGPLAAALLFIGTLFPALGFFNVYPMRFSFVADHFQYLASIAVIAPLAALLWRFGRPWSALVLLPLAGLTLVRTPVYRDEETLWRDTLRKNPSSWMVHTNLANTLIRQVRGDQNAHLYDEAEKHYHEALALAPDLHDTHANVGMLYGYRGDSENALREFDEAIARNPQFAPAWYGKGQVYARLGRQDEAIASYRKALDIAPDYPEANYRLAVALQQRGDLKSAVAHYRKAVGAMPEDRDMRYDLAGALIALGAFDESAYNLREAVRIDPNYAEAWLRLGLAQRQLGRTDDAIESFKTALRLKPELARQIQGR